MTLCEFREMCESDQVAVLYGEGVYVGKRKQGTKALLLYQVDSFYVEVIYRKYRRHIERIRCTAATSVLDPYLEQINVFHLVE